MRQTEVKVSTSVFIHLNMQMFAFSTMQVNYAAFCDSFCTSCHIFSSHIALQVPQVYSQTIFLFEYMNFIKIIHKEKSSKFRC